MCLFLPRGPTVDSRDKLHASVLAQTGKPTIYPPRRSNILVREDQEGREAEANFGDYALWQLLECRSLWSTEAAGSKQLFIFANRDDSRRQPCYWRAFDYCRVDLRREGNDSVTQFRAGDVSFALMRGRPKQDVCTSVIMYECES